MNRPLAVIMVLIVAAPAGCGEAAPDRAGHDAAGRSEASGRGSGQAPGEARGDPTVLPGSIRAELIRLGEADQAAREGLSPERMQDTAFLGAMLRGDSARSRRLREIVDAWGWPHPATAGPDAAHAAFLILQHSPLNDFQEAMLPTLEAAAADGTVPASDVALLVDRVRIQRGEPQRYGTQFAMEDGRLVPRPIQDPAGLAERRRAMGLPPMDEYIRLLEELYDAEVIGPGAADTAG